MSRLRSLAALLGLAALSVAVAITAAALSFRVVKYGGSP